MTSQLIDTQEAFNHAQRRLADASVIGVDTEFLRVRTYYPRLALVQVAAGDAIYCFDPLAGDLELGALWEVLSDPGIVKVMHSARQDIEVLLHTAGVIPAPLFDTQIAAGMLGYSEQTGYASLVEAEFGEVLPKGAQRTDWTKRPLSAAQLGYAGNDVRYLLPLHDRLRARLSELGRLEWAEEDFRRLLEPRLYDTDPGAAYRRVGRGAHLKPPAQYRLKNLCAWREQMARRRDLPRHWVVNDELITAIAAAGPRSVAELERVPGMRREIVQRDGGAIVRCIGEPSGNGDPPLWSRHQPLAPDQKAQKAALVRALQSRAAELGVAESVLVTRSDLERLVQGAAVGDVLEGWRRRELGRALERVLAEPEAVSGATGPRDR